MKNYYIGNYLSSATACAIEKSSKNRTNWKKLITSGALLFSLTYANPRSYAGTVSVNSATTGAAGDGSCDIEEAVSSAVLGSDQASGDCPADYNATAGDFIIFDSIISGSTISPQNNLHINNSANITIDGNSSITITPTHNYSVFKIENADLSLKNITISGANNNIDNLGGAIYMYGGNLEINNSTLKNNQAYYSGGALFIQEPTQVFISDSNISNNTASLRSGGAISAKFTSGGDINISDTIFTGNEVIDNVTFTAKGGAIDVEGEGNFVLKNSTISGNSAKEGGGLFLGDALKYGYVKNSQIVGNSASAYGGGIGSYTSEYIKIVDSNNSNNYAQYAGGGMRFYGGNTIVVENSTINNNSASLSSGGGIHSYIGSKFTIKNSEVKSNYANDKGGGFYQRGGSDLTISNSTFSNNYVSDSKYHAGGGVIISDNDNIVIENATINNNTATFGGGVLIDMTNALNSATIKNSTISGNIANKAAGGMYLTFGDLSVENVTVSGNAAYLSSGGIFTREANVNFNSIAIQDNYSAYSKYHQGSAGGMRSYGGSITITNSVVQNNSAKYAAGLDIAEATIEISESNISGNSALYHGGGIRIKDSNSTISHSNIIGNSADFGGGVDVYNDSLTTTNSIISTTISGNIGGGVDSSRVDQNIVNSTISGNSSSDYSGGGLYANDTRVSYSYDSNATACVIDEPETTINIINSTISGNSTGVKGGSLYFKGNLNVNISNSLLDGNDATQGYTAIYSKAKNYSFTCSENNTSYDINVSSKITGVNNIITGNSNETDTLSFITTDPLLEALADNGGEVLTHAIPSNSPAIDGADSGVLAAFGIVDDQRGIVRASNTSDIGSFEYTTNFAPEITVTTFQVVSEISTIGDVTYSDSDSSTFTFAITGGLDSDKFAIDGATGALTFTSAPLYSNPTDSDGDNFYEVEVKVTDEIGAYDKQTIVVEVIAPTGTTCNDAAEYCDVSNCDSTWGSSGYIWDGSYCVVGLDVNVTFPSAIASDLNISFTLKNLNSTRNYLEPDSQTTYEEVISGSSTFSQSIGTGGYDKFYLGYEIDGNSDYPSSGYYTSTGMVYSLDEAELLDISSLASSVDLNIETGNSVSGTVSGLASGYKLHIIPKRVGGKDAQKIIADGSGGSFSLSVPSTSNDDYVIKYYVEDSSGNIVGRGFYNDTNTSSLVTGATTLSISADTTISMDVNNTSSYESISVSTGWNLLSLPTKARFDIYDLNFILLQNDIDDDTTNPISHITKYDPILGWNFFWDESTSVDHNFSKFTELKSTEGFWLKANSSTTITIPSSGVDSDYANEVDTIASGWNLLGFNVDKTPAEVTSLIEANSSFTVIALWIYRSGGWKVYYPNSTHDSQAGTNIPRIDTIYSSEGVWAKVE